MDYSDFVKYTVLMGMISLPRNELRDKIIKGAEIQENLHQQSNIKVFLMSLYECKYAEFFRNLAEVEIVRNIILDSDGQLIQIQDTFRE
jgi:26S proteasome regulatory subunit N7